MPDGAHATAARRSILDHAKDAIRAVSMAYQDVPDLPVSPDIIAAFRYAAEAIGTLKHLAAVAETVADELRDQLAVAMDEAGCPAVETSTERATTRKAAPFVIVDDETTVPPQYWRQPPRAPDKKAIGVALKDGLPVPGARLVHPNRPVLMFTRLKERVQ